MDRDTKAIGKMASKKERARITTPGVIFIKAPFSEGKLTDLENMNIKIERVMKDNGKIIYRTDKVLKCGKMALSMMGPSKKDSSTGKELM